MPFLRPATPHHQVNKIYSLFLNLIKGSLILYLVLLQIRDQE